jgi:CheY-like chemotaxis protein
MSSTSAPILVVEDHPEMLDTVVTVLERQGWAAVTARNGEEALDQLKNGLRPSLLLIDLMLPKVSGWDLLQNVLEEPEWREIPTLVITGSPERISALPQTCVAQTCGLRPLNQRGARSD